MSRIDYMKLIIDQIDLHRTYLETEPSLTPIDFIHLKAQVRGLTWLYYKERDRYGR